MRYIIAILSVMMASAKMTYVKFTSIAMEDKFVDVVEKHHPKVAAFIKKNLVSRKYGVLQEIPLKYHRKSGFLIGQLAEHHPEIFFTAASVIKSCHLDKNSIITKNGFSASYEQSISFRYKSSRDYTYGSFHDLILECNFYGREEERILFINRTSL